MAKVSNGVKTLPKI